jgi:N-acetylglucosamine-6-phosphate deacetylase
MRETGRMLTPDGWVTGWVDTLDGVITEMREDARADARRMLVPGFIDMHVHGADGADVMDASPEALTTMAEALAREGTTGFLATTLTAPPEALLAALRVPPPDTGAECLGYHLEGPMIAADHRGVQPADAIRVVGERELEAWLDTGRVRVVTVAPELPGAPMIIARLAAAGVRVNLGHSGATFAEAGAGFEAGADGATHLFNAMTGLNHREPGLVGQALDRDGVFVEVIADGYHLAPAVVRLVFRQRPRHVLLVTDSIRARGLEDGTYRLGPVQVRVEAGQARDPEGRLAGSVISQADALRRCLSWGLSWDVVVDALSTAPARRLGLGDRGRLVRGARADWVVLDEDLTVRRTVIHGKAVWDRG